MKKPKVLIVGGGGREHALGWKLSLSPSKPELFFAPGNGGTAEIGQNVDIKATDIPMILAFARREQIDLTIVGPEEPLGLGIVDIFNDAGLRIFGPTKAAAEIELSKAEAKRI